MPPETIKTASVGVLISFSVRIIVIHIQIHGLVVVVGNAHKKTGAWSTRKGMGLKSIPPAACFLISGAANFG